MPIEGPGQSVTPAPYNFDGRIYFRLIAAVLAADGTIVKGEAEKLGELLEWGGVPQDIAPKLLKAALDGREEPLAFLGEQQVSPQLAAIYIRDALFAAHSDGVPGPEEERLIEEAAALLGVGALLLDIGEWVRDSIELAHRGAALFGISAKEPEATASPHVRTE